MYWATRAIECKSLWFFCRLSMRAIEATSHRDKTTSRDHTRSRFSLAKLISADPLATGTLASLLRSSLGLSGQSNKWRPHGSRAAVRVGSQVSSVLLRTARTSTALPGPNSNGQNLEGQIIICAVICSPARLHAPMINSNESYIFPTPGQVLESNQRAPLALRAPHRLE